MTDLSAHHRLATYGTLAPGRSNAAQLADLEGEWTTGIVRGFLKEAGWGAAEGYPGIVLDPTGPEVEVFLLTSRDLPDHWARLDAFEGDGYSRTETTLHSNGQVLVASIYALSEV